MFQRSSDCSVGKGGYLSDMQIDVDPEQDFHVVIDGAAKALSLDELAEAYQADAITDETLIWQDGLEGWMRLDELLAVLGEQEEEAPAASAPISAADPNKYQVLVAPEEIKNMTLTTLVDAQRLGVVDDETLVLPPGGTEWLPLAVVIAEFAMQARASAPPSRAPTQQVTTQHLPTEHAPPQQSAVQAQPSAYPVAPLASTPMANPAPPNTFAPTASNVDSLSQAFRPRSNPAPVLDDLDFPEFQKSKSVWVKRSLLGTSALAAVFAVYLAMGDSETEVAAQPDAAATPSESAIPTAEAEVEVEVEPSAWDKEQALLEQARKKDEAAAKEAANSPTASAFGASLAGESNSNKPAPASAKSKSQKPRAKQAPSPANTGKSQYDPMNGTL